jgi:hypothetical protein
MFDKKNEQQQAFVKIADVVESNRDADACMWTYKEGMGFIPVLIYDDAKAIYDHLMWWCDGRPDKWFKIAIEVRGDQYAVTVIPNFKKSFERWKFARKEFHEDKTTYDSLNVKYIYSALGFSASTCSIKDEAEELLKQPVFRVGFLDLADINKDDPSKSSFENIKHIDGIKMDTSKVAGIHLERMFSLLEGEKNVP